MNVNDVGTVLWRVMSLPATLLHELTHFLLALPWADQSAIIVDDQGICHGVDWTDDAPRWAIILASLGPTFLGALVGIIGLWRLATVPPGGSREWLIAGALAAYWSIYVAPSGDDLDIHETSEEKTDG
jgi:hypothetical protein